MSRRRPVFLDDLSDLDERLEQVEGTAEEDLWFLPGPIEDAPDLRPPGPRLDPGEAAILDAWTRAEAGLAAHLAHGAGLLGPEARRKQRRKPGGAVLLCRVAILHVPGAGASPFRMMRLLRIFRLMFGQAAPI